MSSADGPGTATPGTTATGRKSVWPLAIGYVGIRLGLTIVVGVIVWGIARIAGLDMPPLVAALLAVVIQLPLAWLLFGRLRTTVTTRLAEQAGERTRLRQELRAALDEPAASPVPVEADASVGTPPSAVSDDAAVVEGSEVANDKGSRHD